MESETAGLLVAQRLEKQTRHDLEEKEEVEGVFLPLQAAASLLFQAPPSSEGTNPGHGSCNGPELHISFSIIMTFATTLINNDSYKTMKVLLLNICTGYMPLILLQIFL